MKSSRTRKLRDLIWIISAMTCGAFVMWVITENWESIKRLSAP